MAKDYTLEDGIAAFDLEKYIRDRDPDIRGAEALIDCPHCGKKKLQINLEKKTWHCWVCEVKGPPDALGRVRTITGGGGLIDLIPWIEGCSKMEAFDKIKAAAFFNPVDITQLSSDLFHQNSIKVPLNNGIPYPESFHFIDTIHKWNSLPYLAHRRITLEDCQRFRLGYCTTGRYAWRLVFPVFERDVLRLYQARAMWEKDQQPPGKRYVKSLNPTRSSRDELVTSDALFNLDQAATYGEVTLTEGPIDAIRVGPDGVCIFGKQLSATQAMKLVKWGVKSVNVMLDGPSPTEPNGAWPEAVAAAQKLAPLLETNLIRLPEGDPGDYTREQLRWFVQNQKIPVNQI